MEKIDFKKELKHLYRASASRVEFVDAAKMNFLMIDGQGSPNRSNAFEEAIAALYPLAYTLKFMVKNGESGIDYGVMPLEGLWWADDPSAFTEKREDEWKWTLMIMQPEFISDEMVNEAVGKVEKRKNPRALSQVRFEAFEEGRAAQIMHVGPFAEEGPTIERLHNFIEESAKHKRGRHHEIYLSDFRRVTPEKMKTILRQPVS